MPRTHGYAVKGQRCYGVCNWQARGRVNVIGALVGSKLVTASLFECNVDSDVFHTWVTEDLLPKLPPGCVIVMDNATFHKRQDTQKAIQDAKHTLQFLPPYSPDLNPIEHTWAQAKALRKQNHTDTYSLFQNSKLYHS